jgi:dihydrolipoamide dehydrogenase
MPNYDLIVIGGGPGGYRAAEWAGDRGRSVLLVEEDSLGGVCLNTGCIPTKTLLHAAKSFHLVHDGPAIGIKASDARFDLGDAMKHKNKTVSTLTRGVASALKRRGVTVVSGRGRLTDRRTVRVGDQSHTADKIIIATGSETLIPPIPGIDSEAVLTSTELLSIERMPESISIIGGGYIGMEFASFFSLLGVEVRVIEMMSEIIPFMEPEFSTSLRKQLPAVDFRLGCKVQRIEGRRIVFTDSKGNEDSVESELILAALGRKPRVTGSGFEEIGLDFDAGGVRVDDRMRTNLPGVYAVGDVTGKSLLAHAAYRMAEVAVEDMFPLAGEGAGGASWNRMRYSAVPWVVFTSPEVAGCGMTEGQAVDAGLSIKTASLAMAASGRYLAEHPGERGTIKVVAEAGSGRILGGTILGSGASEIVFGLATAVEHELRAQDLRETIFPHPTVSEVIRDVMWEFAD